MIKKIFIAILPILLPFCLIGCKDGRAEEVTRGDRALAEFYAEDFDGNTVDGSVFSSCKVTMINVWATWCNPCVSEMPALGELDKEFADSGFQVIGIALDTTDRNYNRAPTAYATALDIISQTGADYRHLIPSRSMKSFLDTVQAVPVTVFVDGNGYQIGKTYVGSRSKGAWKKIIQADLEFVNGN